MNTAQHTPGPWACDGISEYTGEVLVRCTAEGVNNGDTVARVCCYGPQSETPFAQAANAQLIAAAPDLLAALIGCVEVMERMYGNPDVPAPKFQAARAAIAKATEAA